MSKCCAPNCYNRSDGGWKIFAVPQGERNAARRKLWLHHMRRSEPVKFRTKLCELHFTPDQFERNRKDGVVKLKPNAVPTIFNHCPATDERWYWRKPTPVLEAPHFVRCDPGILEPNTSSSSYLQVKVEPHSKNEEDSILVKEEYIFQEVKEEPDIDDHETSQTLDNENSIFVVSSMSDVRESSKTVKMELKESDDFCSEMLDVVNQRIKDKNSMEIKIHY